jgi:hypothetical protein
MPLTNFITIDGPGRRGATDRADAYLDMVAGLQPLGRFITRRGLPAGALFLVGRRAQRHRRALADRRRLRRR